MSKAERGRAGSGAFGILLIDKPAGPTSHDVVGWVRWALRERSVGHCGTLDPAATGLLVVCVGAATKLVEYLTAVDKRYLARFVLGRATTTADAEGETLAEAPLAPDSVARAGEALAGLVGELELPPPAYSAIKVDGRRAHDLARAGEDPKLAPRPMTVLRLEPGERGRDWIDADLTVSKGTYVRSLAQELGRRLALPAHLGSLRRLACGELSVEHPEAVTGLVAQRLPDIEGRPPKWRIDAPPGAPGAAAEGPALDPREVAKTTLEAHLLPPWSCLPFPASELRGADHLAAFERLLQGQRLRADDRTCAGLGLAQPPSAEIYALVDRAMGRMILVRHDPVERRLAPIRVLTM